MNEVQYQWIIITRNGEVIGASSFNGDANFDYHNVTDGVLIGWISHVEDNSSYCAHDHKYYSLLNLLAGYAPHCLDPNGFTAYVRKEQ